METNCADQVYQLAKPLFVELRVGIDFGQDAFEGWVDALDGIHGVIEEFADLGLLGAVLQVLPAGGFGHEEDVVCQVLIRVFGVCAFVFTLVFHQLLIQVVERVGDVFEKDEPKHNVFVFGCVHV